MKNAAPTQIADHSDTTRKRSVFGRPPATDKHPGGRPRRPVDLAQVGRLLSEGHSLRQTARRLRVGYGTVHKAIRDAGGRLQVIENCARGCA